MKVITREKYPIDWATNMTNRANAKLERGKLENGVDTLRAAISDYLLALEVRTIKRFPLGYVKTTGNMAIAKRYIADRTQDLALADEARRDIDAALEVVHSGNDEYWRNYYRMAQADIDATISRLNDGTKTTASLHDIDLDVADLSKGQ
jgi:hypothetical protein